MNAQPAGSSAKARAGRSPEQRQADLKSTLATLHAGVELLRSSQGWRAWLDFAARMPTYSLNNQLLIVAQRPQASAVASYTAWKALGRQVRRGETGIRILAPTTRTVPTDVSEAVNVPLTVPSGKGDVREPSRRMLTGFRPVAVFDVSQTDGEPLPTPQRPTLLYGQAPEGLWDALAQQVTDAGFTLSRVTDASELGGANGMTDFAARTVQVRQDVSDAQAVKTLAHELAHVLLHDPLTIPPVDSPVDTPVHVPVEPTAARLDREVKEVEAESVAYLVTAHAGLDSSDYTFGYVAGWSAGSDAAALTKVAGRVLAAAASITDQFTPPNTTGPSDHAVAAMTVDLAGTSRLGAGHCAPATVCGRALTL